MVDDDDIISLADDLEFQVAKIGIDLKAQHPTLGSLLIRCRRLSRRGELAVQTSPICCVLCTSKEGINVLPRR